MTLPIMTSDNRNVRAATKACSRCVSYGRHRPLRVLDIKVRIFSSMRFSIGSHFSWSWGETRHDRLALKIMRATIFKAYCRGRTELFGIPASTELQWSRMMANKVYRRLVIPDECDRGWQVRFECDTSHWHTLVNERFERQCAIKVDPEISSTGWRLKCIIPN